MAESISILFLSHVRFMCIEVMGQGYLFLFLTYHVHVLETRNRWYIFQFFSPKISIQIIERITKKFEFLVEAVECFDKRKFLNEKNT